MLEVGAVLLRRRWHIVRFMFLGAVVAGLWGLSRSQEYVAWASFAPTGVDQSRSGLASLAGQFGVALPTGSQSLSPEFYASLLQSRSLLLPIVRDTFLVEDLGGRRVALLDLFEIGTDAQTLGVREDRGVTRIRKMITAATVKSTGVVTLSVATRWRDVSLAIATKLLNGVNDFNQRTRHEQAAAERKFIEARLALAGQDLRSAEERLRGFLEHNRAISNAPDLVLERDRIQRDVTLRQQVFTSLTQSYEDARLREVRDTPVLTIVEAPSVRAEPEPRGRLKLLILGTALGGIVAAVSALMSEMATRRRGDAQADAEEFVAALREAKGDVLRPVRWVGTRIRR